MESDLQPGAGDDLADFKESFLDYLNNPPESGDAFSRAAGVAGDDRIEPGSTARRADQVTSSSGAKRGPIKVAHENLPFYS